MPRHRWTRTVNKATINVAFLTVLGVAAGATVLYGVASAKSSPPAPTLTSQPSSPTTSTSATFAFTDKQSGVAYQCSLDHTTPSACTSPKTYTSLTDGTHTFAVSASAGGSTSSATTATWRVDTTPPSITLTFPKAGGSYNAAGWNGGCTSAPGICGTASDPSGVAWVRVSVLQASSGHYWNGSSFSSTSEVYNLASGTTSWTYALGRPSDGSYTAHVRAADALGNTTPLTSPTTATFSIDTVPPPAPVITQSPTDPTSNTAATFAFTDGESGVTFRCSLDGAAFSNCTSPVSYSNLSSATHVFKVEALDAAGNVGGPTSYSWTVATGGFPISGNVAQPLYPGAIRAMNLTFTNPFTFAIKVTSVAISVAHGTSVNGQPDAGCDGPANVVVEQGFSAPVVIPKNSSASLQSLGVDPSHWPQIEMLNLSTNQDACKGAVFSFTYSGTAVKAV
jgi:hypothetical protein